MASVPLEFTPPAQEDIVALRIYESPVSTGPFVQIERITDVGTYPNYISSYTTQEATDAEYWFQIAWEGEGGSLSEQSNPVKGGTLTLPGEVTDRVMQRDGSLNRAVVLQEAEAVIQSYYGGDPYDIEVSSVSYVKMRGLVNLTLAHCLLLKILESTGSAESAKIGLVELKSSSSSALKLREVEALIEFANNALGIWTSLVLQMEDVQQRILTVNVMEP